MVDESLGTASLKLDDGLLNAEDIAMEFPILASAGVMALNGPDRPIINFKNLQIYPKAGKIRCNILLYHYNNSNKLPKVYIEKQIPY